jgi:hypothetical protein
MCNTIHLGLCLKTLTKEFCGCGFQSNRDWRKNEEAIKYVVEDKTLELSDTKVIFQTIGPNLFHAFVNSKDNSSYQCSKFCCFFLVKKMSTSLHDIKETIGAQTFKIIIDEKVSVFVNHSYDASKLFFSFSISIFFLTCTLIRTYFSQVIFYANVGFNL